MVVPSKRFLEGFRFLKIKRYPGGIPPIPVIELVFL